ncbi:MAG: hypothetical protein SFU25_03090 [Candidatus Caenarcaniphilales bacterium]|nr:hypothetical protein [Candidatus Caenarcaniphilales bacterium]
MVQRLLDDKLSSKESGDFSSLAWRFNNLNSTAKMLLVGAAPSSVPFIPISELASNDSNTYDLTNKANQVNNLSLASLSSSPSSSHSSAVITRPVTEKPNFYSAQPTLRTIVTPQQELAPNIRNDFKAIKITEESSEKSTKLSKTFSPIAFPQAAQKQNEEENILENEQQEITDSEKDQSKRKSNNQRVLIDPKPILTDKGQTGYRASSLSQIGETENVDDKTEENNISAFPFAGPLPQTDNRNQVSSNLPSTWSYKGLPSPEEESEYYSLKEELSRKQDKERGIAPFIKNTVKTVAVLSLIALLGFGAYNLLKRPSTDKDIDTYVNETDPLNNDTNESDLYSAESSASQSTESSSTSNSKTFFNEDNDQKKLIASHKDDTYAPKITPKIYTKKPVVAPNTLASPYKAPNLKQTLSPGKASGGYYTVNQADYQVKEEPVLLYDPATVYDSAASEAISPETYTAAKFPIELSYARSTALFEAPISADALSSSALSPSQADTQIDTEQYESDEEANTADKRVNSGYPSTNTPTNNISSPYTAPAIDQDIQQTQDGIADDLTQEEKQILNSPKSSTQPSLESVPAGINSSNPYQSSFQSGGSNNYSSPKMYQEPETEIGKSNAPITAPKIYSKPVKEIEEVNDFQQQGYESDKDLDEDESFSVPILREPVRSSSNITNPNAPLPSPYTSPNTTSNITLNTPMTTSSFVLNSTTTQAPAAPQRTYTQAKRGKVVRFMDRFSSEKSKANAQQAQPQQTQNSFNKSSVNSSYNYKINDLQRRAQDGSLSDYEKQKLLSEVESLKQEIISGQPSKKRFFNKSSSSNSDPAKVDSTLKTVESDASKVYVQPSPYSEEEGSSLNLSFLEN